jgi:hypothetical protein
VGNSAKIFPFVRHEIAGVTPIHRSCTATCYEDGDDGKRIFMRADMDLGTGTTHRVAACNRLLQQLRVFLRLPQEYSAYSIQPYRYSYPSFYRYL